MGLDSTEESIEATRHVYDKGLRVALLVDHDIPAGALERMRYMLALESFLDDPYEYTPHPSRTVLSGVLPPGGEAPARLRTSLPLTVRSSSRRAGPPLPQPR